MYVCISSRYVAVRIPTLLLELVVWCQVLWHHVKDPTCHCSYKMLCMYICTFQLVMFVYVMSTALFLL